MIREQGRRFVGRAGDPPGLPYTAYVLCYVYVYVQTLENVMKARDYPRLDISLGLSRVLDQGRFTLS